MADLFDTAMANAMPKLPRNRAQGELVHARVYPTEVVNSDSVPKQILVTPLQGRRQVMLQNEGLVNVRIGFDATITGTTGNQLAAGDTNVIAVGPGVELWAILEAAGSVNINGYEGY